MLFTNIGGAQHDHGIHAFLFGPDGKLYFNFGNAGQTALRQGRQARHRHGRQRGRASGNAPIRKAWSSAATWTAANVETLGWNFRNNWEVAVDSLRHDLAERQRRRRQQGRAHQLRDGVRQLRLHRTRSPAPAGGPTRRTWRRRFRCALAPERSRRRAEPAADRRRFADRHLRLRRRSPAGGVPRPADPLRRRPERRARLPAKPDGAGYTAEIVEHPRRDSRPLVPAQRCLRRARRFADRRRLVRSGRRRPRHGRSRARPHLPRRP